MQLLTKDGVLKAFRAEVVSSQAEGNTQSTYWLDSGSQFEDGDDDDANLPLPEVKYIRSDNGLRIELVFSNERAEISVEDAALFSFLEKNVAIIPAHVAEEIRSEILKRSTSVGGVVRRIWTYDLNNEQILNLLTRLVDDVIPTEAMTMEICQDFRMGFGELKAVDCSPSSQEFHRKMLEIGVYPTIFHDEDEPDSQMRLMYGDERFESFDADDWEKFKFSDPES